MTAAPGAVTAEVRNGIGLIVIDHAPRLNAMTLDMWQQIGDHARAMEADPAVRVLVVSGAGEKSFCVGADISEFATKRSTVEQAEEYEHVVESSMHALATCAKPTVAKIRGFCVGGGLEIAMCCDIRIAAEGSQFGIPAAKLSIGYAYWGVAMLAELVGPMAAKEIFYTGRRFPAEKAARMGLVADVLTPGELDAYVDDYVAEIAANAPLTIAAVKRSVTEWLRDPGDRDLAAVHRMVDACSGSADYAEGRQAFMEKRKPQFQGR